MSLLPHDFWRLRSLTRPKKMQNRGWKIKDGARRSKSKRIYPAEEASGPGENLQVNEVSRGLRRYSS